MKRRFEEILEECLSAQLEGRRSIEESLSLYPSMARELEPLLRTASNISHAFEALTPPSYLQERGRLRFLTASSERRRARNIARGVWGFDRTRRPWNFRQWGLLGSGVAAVLALLVAGSLLLLGGSGGHGAGRSAVGHQTTPASSPTQNSEFVANLNSFQDTLRQIKDKAARGELSESDLRALRDATTKLIPPAEPLDDVTRQQVEHALSDSLVLAAQLSVSPPPGTEDDLQDLTSVTQKAANDIGIEIPTPSPTEPPVATATPVQTAQPTETPAPTAPATETPAPTEAPTPPLQGVE